MHVHVCCFIMSSLCGELSSAQLSFSIFADVCTRKRERGGGEREREREERGGEGRETFISLPGIR